MKVDIKKIELHIDSIDDTYKAKSINDVFEKFTLHPFVYNSQQPKYFKLVLTWELLLKDNATEKNILKCTADQEFIMQLDGNKDKEILINMIRTSEMHFEEVIQNVLKKSGLGYSIKYADYNTTADNIIALVRTK